MDKERAWKWQVRALARLLKGAWLVGYFLYHFLDGRGNLYEADLMAGTVARIKAVKGSHLNRAIRNPEQTLYKDGYPVTRIYLPTESGDCRYCAVYTHLILALLGEANRNFYRESGIRAITPETQDYNRLNNSVNHNDMNRRNNRAHNIPWHTGIEQSAHKLACIVRASRGARTVEVPYSTSIATALRADGEYDGEGGLALAAGVNILADMFPGTFGRFYEAHGVNNALIGGEPAANVYADMLSAAKLPDDSAKIAVLTPGFTYTNIITGVRSPWLVLDDMHRVGAIKILGEVEEVQTNE